MYLVSGRTRGLVGPCFPCHQARTQTGDRDERSFLKATCVLGPVLSAVPTACQLLLPLSSRFYSDSALKPKIEHAISSFQTASWSLTDSVSFVLTPWKCSYTCLSVIYPRIKSCTRGGEVAPVDGLPRDPAAPRSRSPGTNLCTRAQSNSIHGSREAGVTQCLSAGERAAGPHVDC